MTFLKFFLYFGLCLIALGIVRLFYNNGDSEGIEAVPMLLIAGGLISYFFSTNRRKKIINKFKKRVELISLHPGHGQNLREIWAKNLIGWLREIEVSAVPLQRWKQKILISDSGRHPILLVILAEDDFKRKQTGSALNRLMEFATNMSSDIQLSVVGNVLENHLRLKIQSIPEIENVLWLIQATSVINRFVHSNDRKKALQEALLQLDKVPVPLPEVYETKLKEILEKRPEVSILLAANNFKNDQPTAGFIYLGREMDNNVLDEGWLAKMAISEFKKHLQDANTEVERSLWEKVKANGSESGNAGTALIAIVLEKGLSPEMITILGSYPANSIVSLLLSLLDVYEGRIHRALPLIIEHLQQIPANLILPKLQKYAAETEFEKKQWFFRKSERPQILEMIERPLTSIYGSRITCWAFSEAKPNIDFEQVLRNDQVMSEDALMQLLDLIKSPGAAEPKMFAVTGHGPSAVCSRVSAILNDLANDRNCPSDVILAGTAFFDLTEELSHSSYHDNWNQEKLLTSMRELALPLSIDLEDLLEQGNVGRIVHNFVGNIVKPTIKHATESIAHIEKEMGFVGTKKIDIHQLDEVCAAFINGSEFLPSESFPVFREYHHNSNSLRISIPLLCLGIEEYEHVVNEYRRSTCNEMRQEWERRRRKYKEWCENFVHNYRWLQRELASNPAIGFETVYIQALIDPEAATERRLDTPEVKTKSDYLESMPENIVSELAYWAWAEHKMETLPKENSFRPHWEKSCLIDAFLRGWPLPSEDKVLNEARKNWSEWRPLALLAMDNNLKKQGLTLSDIAVENTVFRVMHSDKEQITLGVYHVFDPYYDSKPKYKNSSLLFSPAFGNRQATLTAAKTAQEEALKIMTKQVLETKTPLVQDLNKALSLDSGQALNLLLTFLCQPFDKGDLDDDIEIVKREATEKLNPLVLFRQKEKYPESASETELVQFARKFGEKGREQDAPPDFLAWELYLCGLAARQKVFSTLATLPFHSKEQSVYIAKRINAEATPWELVKVLVQPDRAARTEVLAYVDFTLENWKPLCRQVQLSFPLLMNSRKDTEYFNKCLHSAGPPPRSQYLKDKYAPGCFNQWKQACYDIAEADEAVAFAWAIQEGSTLTKREELTALRNKVKSIPIPPTFEHINIIRNELFTGLQKFELANAVTLNFASAHVRHAIAEAVTLAESLYRHAALRDVNYGCGWLRLARLKWMTGHYREAIQLIAGEAPSTDLEACQLPLHLAVRSAGGNLSFTGQPSAPWNPKHVNMNVAVDGHELALDFTADEKEIGSCRLAGLDKNDMDLLAEFFTKHQPDMFKAPETKSLQEWVSLIQSPNIGKRSTIAGLVQGDNEFPLLVSCAHYGLPPMLNFSDDTVRDEQLSEWREKDIITKLVW